MKLLYFARLRELVGLAEEDVALPAHVRDVQTLIAWLKSRGANYERALARPAMVRVAVNERHAALSDPVSEGDEVALFPPVTGGGR